MFDTAALTEQEKRWPCAVRPGFVVFQMDSDGEPSGKFYGPTLNRKGETVRSGDKVHLTLAEIKKNRPRIYRLDEKTGQTLPPNQTVPGEKVVPRISRREAMNRAMQAQQPGGVTQEQLNATVAAAVAAALEGSQKQIEELNSELATKKVPRRATATTKD